MWSRSAASRRCTRAASPSRAAPRRWRGCARGSKCSTCPAAGETQAIYYAREFGVRVTGVDLAPQMVETATERAREAGLLGPVSFQQGDSQALPFKGDSFDVVINECAVGIPDDSQRVIEEMVRVTRPGGVIVIHESIWKGAVTPIEKDEIAERYGTTPFELDEWREMLKRAGAVDIVAEHEEWSRPEMFWEVRKDRTVGSPRRVLTPREKARTALRILRTAGARGLFKAFENERVFYSAVRQGKLGYCLYWGQKPAAVQA